MVTVREMVMMQNGSRLEHEEVPVNRRVRPSAGSRQRRGKLVTRGVSHWRHALSVVPDAFPFTAKKE
jgi:hypothetical protein